MQTYSVKTLKYTISLHRKYSEIADFELLSDDETMM